MPRVRGDATSNGNGDKKLLDDGKGDGAESGVKPETRQVDAGEGEPKEWTYEVEEIRSIIRHDPELGTYYEHTARLGITGINRREGLHAINRFYRDNRANNKYVLGDVYIHRLIGPIGREPIDESSSDGVSHER